MDFILKGIITGFILSVMIGPVFFVLLETSIRKGVRAALAVDLGVLVSDIVYIAIAFVFYKQVEDLQKGDNNAIVHIIGGVLFAAYGAASFFKKVKFENFNSDVKVAIHAKDYLLLGLKGFLLNIANPLVIFYWFSVMALGSEDATKDSSSWTILLFLITILITIFSNDFLKILGAKKLRPLVTKRLLVGLNRLIGIVFVGFSIFLIVEGISKL